MQSWEEEEEGRCCGSVQRGTRRGSRGATLKESCWLAVVLGLAFCAGVADAKTWIPLWSHDPGSSAPAPAVVAAAASAPPPAAARARARESCCCFGKARMMSAAGLMPLRGGARKESFPAATPESFESDSGEMFSDGSLPTSTTKGEEGGARKDDDRGEEEQDDKEKDEEEKDDDDDPFPVPRVLRLQKEGKLDVGMGARMHKVPGADSNDETSSASSRVNNERGWNAGDDGDDDGGAYEGASDIDSSLDVEVIHGDERPRMVVGGADETGTKEGIGTRKKIKTALAYEVGKLPPGWRYKLPKETDLEGGCNTDDIEGSFALIPDDYGRIDYGLARKGGIGEGRKKRGGVAAAQGEGEVTSRSVYVGGLHFKVTQKHQTPNTKYQIPKRQQKIGLQTR